MQSNFSWRTWSILIEPINIKNFPFVHIVDSEFLSAKQAARLLGVSLSTLYSYVSRGLLHSQGQKGQRSKYYAREDVLRLQIRNSDSRRAGSAAESAIAWGVPVLESRISLVTDGQLHYRGQHVSDLARNHSLEEVAMLLWNMVEPDVFQSMCLPISETAWQQHIAVTAHLPPITRAMSILPALDEAIETRGELHTCAKAVIWMRCLAAALLASTPNQRSFHAQLATCWQVDSHTADALRAALVICADHELNVSAFTVRCVASTGAHLGMALCAGLGALSGPKHGGESLRIGRFVRTGLQAHKQQLREYLENCIASHQVRENFSARLPGFGHPLYPMGDPRGAILMQLLDKKKNASLFEFAELAQSLTGDILNIDYGLVALEIAYGLPQGAAQILFALGRSAGWTAHAMEQVQDGQLIRPRARYVGKFPY